MSKRILVDCDGVILNWEYAFRVWLEHHGHDPVVIDQGLFYKVADQYGLNDEKVIRLVKNFNESAAIGFLPPVRDAVQYIRKLHEKHDYVLHVITSVGEDENVGRLRTMNLHKLFGASAIEHVECLGMGDSKTQYLETFKGTDLPWIEDNIRNAVDGLNCGLSPLLFEHGYNMDYKNPSIPLVKNWKEIYKLLT